MVGDQGTGPVGRSSRNRSTSAPCSNTEDESMPEADVQMQQPAQHERKSATRACPSQVSPRRCGSAPKPSSPTTTALSPRDNKTSYTSTPQAEPDRPTRRSSHTSSAPAHPIEPPVTRATLSELDVTKIIHNPKLRHDINFDPELHFRPNLDGEKGRKKQDRANQFWRSLKTELSMFIADREQFYLTYGRADDWTLPTLLKAVKEIIQTLVPQRDRHFLDEGLNVELLMQQFNKGVADLEKLAQWLSQVLKSHCAPMRDDWVDAMYKQLSNGNSNADLDELVNGMRSLLSVLEAMKLDVANHQIRCLRPVLIEDTIHFEYKFFYKKIQSQKIDTSSAKQWYKTADAQHADNSTYSSLDFGETGVFFEALSRLILPSSPDKRLPSTFLFDEERILKLRSDMLDAISLEVCLRMYEDLERIGRSNSSGLFGTPTLDADAISCSSSPTTEFKFNTSLEMSRPWDPDFSVADSRANSPRTAANLPAQVAPDDSKSRNRTRNLSSSIVDLLQSATPGLQQSARWQSLSSSIALQIFRYTDAPKSLLAAFEERLADSVCGMDSPLYREVERFFHTRLMVALNTRVREYRSLSGVSLYSAATTSRAQNNALGRDRESEHTDGVIEDIAVRLAHLGVLHWRVWSELAYTKDCMAVDAQN